MSICMTSLLGCIERAEFTMLIGPITEFEKCCILCNGFNTFFDAPINLHLTMQAHSHNNMKGCNEEEASLRKNVPFAP